MVSAAHLEFLRSIDSPTIANAIERFAIRDRTDGYLGGSIRCLFPDLGVLVGHALTVTMDSRPGPVADRDGYWRMWEALEAAPRPSVLVVADGSGRPTRCAYVGEVMATMALRLGAVGLVTDAGVRDLAEVEALGFHLFAAHVVVSHGNFRVADVGSDVTLDGQLVRTGDLLHGDRNGIVLVPETILDELPSVVDTIRTTEAATIADARSPEFSVREARRRAGY
jgi:regulator of RNase E activity RraA